MANSSVAYSLALENGGVTTYLVEEQILASPATSAVFSNLDALRDGGYELEVIGAPGVASVVYCYINGDTNNSNYTGRRIYTSGGGTPGEAVLQPFATSDSQMSYAKISISQPVDSKVTMLSNFTYQGAGTEYLMYTSTRYGISVSNINSITLLGGTNCFGAGTIIRLYRKLNGETAAFVPLQSNLVADILVPSTTSEVNLTGLDGNLHGGYTIISNFLAAGGTTEALQLWINGDTTAGNYTFRSMYGGGTSPAATTIPTYHYLGLSYNGRRSGGVTYINPGDAPCIVSSFWGHNIGGTYSVLNSTSFVGPTNSNITSLLFKSIAANMIAAGTRIQVYRNK